MALRREFNRRELRGLAIVAKGGMIKRTDDNAYLVIFGLAEILQSIVEWKGMDLRV